MRQTTSLCEDLLYYRRPTVCHIYTHVSQYAERRELQASGYPANKHATVLIIRSSHGYPISRNTLRYTADQTYHDTKTNKFGYKAARHR